MHAYYNLIEEYHRFEMSYTCIYFFFTHYEYALRSYNAYKKGLDGAMYNSNNFLHQQKCTNPLSLIRHDRRLTKTMILHPYSICFVIILIFAHHFEKVRTIYLIEHIVSSTSTYYKLEVKWFEVH